MKSYIKKYILIFICVIAASFTCKEDFKLNGEWQLSLVRLNSDTMFYRDHIEYSYRYNWKLYGVRPKTQEDSNAVLKRAKEGYNTNMEYKIVFYKDSLSQITNINSKGAWYSNKLDSGVYSVSNDTLLMTNRSRDNKRMMLTIDQQKQKLYLNDGVPYFIIYQEYSRKKQN